MRSATRSHARGVEHAPRDREAGELEQVAAARGEQDRGPHHRSATTGRDQHGHAGGRQRRGDQRRGGRGERGRPRRAPRSRGASSARKAAGAAASSPNARGSESASPPSAPAAVAGVPAREHGEAGRPEARAGRGRCPSRRSRRSRTAPRPRGARRAPAAATTAAARRARCAPPSSSAVSAPATTLPPPPITPTSANCEAPVNISSRERAGLQDREARGDRDRAVGEPERADRERRSRRRRAGRRSAVCELATQSAPYGASARSSDAICGASAALRVASSAMDRLDHAILDPPAGRRAAHERRARRARAPQPVGAACAASGRWRRRA